MKLEYTDGCMSFSTTIDGKEIADIENTTTIKDVIHKLVDRIDDVGCLQRLFTDLMSELGEYEDLGQCEQCGDWVFTYKLEI